MSPPSPRRLAIASNLLVLLLGLTLALTMIAAGSRVANGSMGDVASLFDAEQEEGGNPDRDDETPVAIGNGAPELLIAAGWGLTFVEFRSEAAQRAHVGHGARAPPIA